MRVTDFTLANGRPPADVKLIQQSTELAPSLAATPHAFTLVEQLERSIKVLNKTYDTLLKSPPDALQARSLMWTQQVRQSGALMQYGMHTLNDELRQQVLDVQDGMLAGLKSAVPVPFEGASDVGVRASDDFFDKLIDLIDLIKNGYLAGYEHILKAYSEFFDDFNTEVTAKMKDWIKGANDGKDVEVNAAEIRYALQRIIEKYSHPNPGSVLFPAPGMGSATREEADKWRLALGLPANCLKQNSDGSFSVVMDLSPLITMRDSLPSGAGWVTWSTPSFQAWQTGFNAQEERLKNMLQSYTQKYSNANSYHDNFNRTLSSHLNQYADMLKAMLNF
ncbi:IpaD/SipD/SspD family type III secretion system needle tip protein [Rhodococcus sp. IEGM1300]